MASTSPRLFALNAQRPRGGFTLLEALIVLAVIAILAALAVPAYSGYLQRSRRADATTSLLETAQELDRCFSRTSAYNAADCPDPNRPSADGFYALSATLTARTFLLTATPVGPQAGDDCGNFTLDQLGNRTPPSSPERCWGTR